MLIMCQPHLKLRRRLRFRRRAFIGILIKGSSTESSKKATWKSTASLQAHQLKNFLRFLIVSFIAQDPGDVLIYQIFFQFKGEQRLQGWVALHFLTALYLFIVLAFICDKYFLPSVERICEVLKISPVS